MEPIGPDEEIEVLGKQFEAYKAIHPTTMTFQQYIALYERKKSNAWAYECNRRNSTLISF